MVRYLPLFPVCEGIGEGVAIVKVLPVADKVVNPEDVIVKVSEGIVDDAEPLDV